MTILEHHFSAGEYDLRRSAAMKLAAAVNAGAVLAFGENRSGLHVTYLNGWAVTRSAWLRLDDAGCRMWVQFHNHIPYARRVVHNTQVLDVDSTTIETLLAGHGAFATLGNVPSMVSEAARGAGIALIPIDKEHANLRIVKSAEEVAALRLGAQASDVGAQALIDACVVGATDWDLLAAARSAYTRVGGRDHICYIAVTDSSGADRDVPSQVPEGRVLSKTSVVTFELSASVSPEYPGQVLRTVTLGPAADPYGRLHEVAMTARTAVRSAIMADVPATDLVKAAGCIEDSGFTTTDDLFHGLGMGYLPPIGTSRSRVPRLDPSGDLEAGMAIVVQPNVTTRDHSAGVQTGEMVIVTDSGFEDIHSIPEGMVMAA